ncbi:MAG: hypothetical protein LBQ48_02190 [Oscillospiraceae bacterium]|nr:hypothetical protein [Oscillospiraceae bacterium]
MTQYRTLKEANPGCIIMFRLGGFYEMFGQDAYIAFKTLGLKITPKNVGGEHPTPMCGFPASAVEKHSRALSENGYKIAICNQVAGVAGVGGIVHREVSEIVNANADVTAGDSHTETYSAFLEEFLETLKELAKINPDIKQSGAAALPPEAQTLPNELRDLALDDMTPMTALNLLHELKRKYG